LPRQEQQLAFGDLTLRLTRLLSPDIEIVVVPEDVNLVMEDVAVIEADDTTLEETLGDIRRFVPRPLGSVVERKRGAGPPILAAVVYDFSRKPAASTKDVFVALLSVFEIAHRMKKRSIAIEPLGTRPAAITPSDFWEALLVICRTTAKMGAGVERVDLLCETDAESHVFTRLLHAASRG
jgi:hypothetical protein